MPPSAKRTLTLRHGTRDPAPALPRKPPGQPAPVSFAQEQIWLHGQLAPSVPLYTESLTIRHRGPLDPRALRTAFEAIVRRHAIWRTTFAWSGGELRQQVHADLPVAFAVTDLRALPELDREQAAIRFAQRDLARPFDLTREAGVRARLVQLSDDDQRLFLCLHHLVFDGISIYRVVLPELAALYDATLAGEPSPFPEPTLHYADFAYWERQAADELTFASLTEYWRRQLAGAPPTAALTADHPRPATQSFRGNRVRFEIPPDLTAGVRSAARAEQCTVFMLLLTGFATTLQRWSRQTEFLIGSVSGGRDRPELECLVGYFLRILVLRLETGDDPPFRAFLHRVREVLLDALCHDGLPFQRLVRALAPDRDLSRSPLFQVTFSIEPPLPRLGGAWDLTEMDAGTTVSKFDLSIELEDRERVIGGRAIYSTDLFEARTIGQLVRDYVSVLAQALAEPERRLHNFTTSR